MLLQTRGFRVTVLEKQDRLGGRAGGLRLGPYVFDVGATMLGKREVLDLMFTLAGRSRPEELKVLPVEPMYRVDFGGDSLTVFADPTAMTRELQRFAAGAGATELHAFLTQERDRFARLYPVLRRSWPVVTSLAGPVPFEGDSWARGRLGGSGIDHVEGGLHRIPSAFARVAEEAGASIRRGARVRRVLVDGGRARAVELEDGQRIGADAVIVSADATQALLRLLGDVPVVRFSRRELTSQPHSLSAFTLYLGLDALPPIAHHTFFASGPPGARVGAEGELPVYACNPVVTDASMAPRDHAALHLVALVPNLGDAGADWFREARRLRERVLDLFARRTGFDPRPHIRAEARLTPEDWESRFETSHGAVFGPEADLDVDRGFAVPSRLASPDNVYLTGGGAGAASGLPAVLSGARTVAELLCDAHGVPFAALAASE
jgi:phytoene desaturase